MNTPPPFSPGDRVRAIRRPGFPAGTVLRILDLDFVLVRWDGDTLETSHRSELAFLEPPSTDQAPTNSQR